MSVLVFVVLTNECACFSGVEIDQNGLDSNLDDSDSNTRSKTSITPPSKEKRKPFFKKVNTSTDSKFVCFGRD